MPMVYEYDGESVVHGLCFIPLARARICVSCEIVLDQDFSVCPRCGHRRIDDLAPWLTRIASAASPATTWVGPRSGSTP